MWVVVVTYINGTFASASSQTTVNYFTNVFYPSESNVPESSDTFCLQFYSVRTKGWFPSCLLPACGFYAGQFMRSSKN